MHHASPTSIPRSYDKGRDKVSFAHSSVRGLCFCFWYLALACSWTGPGRAAAVAVRGQWVDAVDGWELGVGLGSDRGLEDWRLFDFFDF